jgi:hypothetical protein
MQAGKPGQKNLVSINSWLAGSNLNILSASLCLTSIDLPRQIVFLGNFHKSDQETFYCPLLYAVRDTKIAGSPGTTAGNR